MPSDLKLSVHSVTPDVTLTLSDPYIGSAYSPQVDVTEIEGGHEVTITHKAPSGIITDTFDVLDGVDGTDGVDGVSPTVEIESTTDAHTITITDADGAHSYTVDTYADEEAARATAESSRVAAESSRVTAEQARATAESSRAAAESARVTAEASRATAEQSRAAAETARESAESTRATAETARATAESARATAEQGRATAEQARAAAETARASAESVRVTAEQGRASAENARASAESARATAETARASAETSRANAETARAAAESTRATEWATIKAEAEDAISAVETATSDAQDATSDATAAAAEARAASAATWLSGNVLFGELAEGTVLTTDDAYSAPPKGVEVYGKSTQVVTTGKNLLSDDMNDWPNRDVSGASRPTLLIPVESGATYTYHRNKMFSLGVIAHWYNETTSDKSSIGTWTYQDNRTVTNDGGWTHLSLAVTGVSTEALQFCEAQVEKGSSFTSYERYSGAVPSPSPTVPQQIDSVDALTLQVCAKNIFDSSLLLRAQYSSFDGEFYHISGYYLNRAFPLVEGGFPVPIYGKQVTLSFDGKNDNTDAGAATANGINFIFMYTDGSSDTLKVYGTTLTHYTLTTDLSKTLKALYFSYNANYTALVKNIRLEFGGTATDYEPYFCTTIPIPLSNNSIRSLPDGTRDTLTLSYIGPSTREGWGVFGATLTQNIYEVTFDGSEDWARKAKGNDPANGYYFAIDIDRNYPLINGSLSASSGNQLWSHYVKNNPYDPNSASNTAWLLSNTDWNYNSIRVSMPSVVDTVDAFKAWLAQNPVTVNYRLREPTTHDLGTIELPILPCPMTAWADGGSAQPTMSMGYEQDINIVISRLKDAIADMATS